MFTIDVDEVNEVEGYGVDDLLSVVTWSASLRNEATNTISFASCNVNTESGEVTFVWSGVQTTAMKTGVYDLEVFFIDDSGSTTVTPYMWTQHNFAKVIPSSIAQ